MLKILIVCTANICRSPTGEVILKNLVTHDGVDEFIHISSAGILGIEGEPASDFSISVARENGLHLESHRSQGITPDMMEESDIILCMTPDHAEKLKYLYPDQRDRIYPLKEYLIKEELLSYSIEDPIGLSIDFYRKIFYDIKTEMERIYPFIKKMAQASSKDK
jgi:protein-tyrosine-phosphatase